MGLGAMGVSTGRDVVRVLLVEDDDGDALLVEDLLTDTLPRAQLVRSSTFDDALSQLDSRVDCVLLDLELPDAHGLDTVVRLRERAPEIPLVVLTGLNDEAAGVAAVDAGAQDYLVKGDVDGGQLARAIRYSIGRRQAADAQQQLRVAEIQSHEVARLERGLAPRPLIDDSLIWMASQYRAGRNRALLGGDFFDVAQTPQGCLRMVVGDVCGNGADEAAIGVCLRAAWRALAISGVDCEVVARTLERVLEQERGLPHLFTTLCTFEIDLSHATAGMVQAGHPPPLLIDGAAISPLEHPHGGPPIGLTDGDWSSVMLDLPSEWVMLLYTDGIIEGKIGDGPQRLGTDGLQRLLAEQIAEHPSWRERPTELLVHLIARAEELNGGELTDDVATLLVGSHGPPSGAA